jgi:Zn-dependent peptidase ImmA (M78 family)
MRKHFQRSIDLQASTLLRKHALFAAPIDIEALAKRLGARVLFDDLDDDVSGFLLREKNVSTIAVNQLHHPNRQRFTIAHECGHLVLHANKGDQLWVDKTFSPVFFRNSNSSSGEKFQEIQANQFAAGVLMPEELLRQQLKGDVTDMDILRLALKFKVSEQAMTLRLVALDMLETA